ncbi:nitrate ABC transporter permease [Skermanella sp. TT6]|uniref:Nitrate ABC transporter permease n=1 Tax=Skermanella cutis TaxID=2775420 RepID=A0ABX7B9P8_9PROT|nr:nitrate ABC transporter permease [Skermanella sp. TT6]QQP91087.1 nitrate ABC transporter permease [Skermanella sp. TT6]
MTSVPVDETTRSPAVQPQSSLPAAPSAAARLRERVFQALPDIVLPAITLLVVLLAWHLVAVNLGGGFPGIGETWERGVELLSDPFYSNGPNDMGLFWQVLYSLGRVMAGFLLAALVGVPVGFLMGSSAIFRKGWAPLIQILRPVSPLAWLPIGLLLFRAVDPSAIFVIFITSIWPMILNTAAGVEAIPNDYRNVAAVLRLNRIEMVRHILLPATLPHVLTGMRLSLGIAWMVIVAAEMLTGGIGIGFFVWDEWNNLNVSSIIVAIVVIGLVGILLDMGMNLIQRRFDHTKR